MIIVFLKFSSPINLKYVFCKSEYLFSSSRFKYCFGKLDRDRGHNLEPDPPDKITGPISGSVINCSIVFSNKFVLIPILFFN